MRKDYTDPISWKRYRDTDYWVSTEGKVKRVRNGKEKPMKARLKNGVVWVSLKGNNYSLARLVYETFIGEIPEGYVVTHINGARTMNDVCNLELATKSKMFRNIRKKNTKRVLNLETGKVYRSAEEASKDIGICKRTIYDYCNGNVKNPICKLKWIIDDD